MDCYVTRLESLISVIEDVSPDLDTSTSETLSHLHYRICHLLFQISSSNTSCSSITPVSMPTMYISNGGPGRPRIVINMEMVELLRSTNFTWDEIAKLVGVSRSTL